MEYCGKCNVECYSTFRFVHSGGKSFCLSLPVFLSFLLKSITFYTCNGEIVESEIFPSQQFVRYHSPPLRLPSCETPGYKQVGCQTQVNSTIDLVTPESFVKK